MCFNQRGFAIYTYHYCRVFTTRLKLAVIYANVCTGTEAQWGGFNGPDPLPLLDTYPALRDFESVPDNVRRPVDERTMHEIRVSLDTCRERIETVSGGEGIR